MPNHDNFTNVKSIVDLRGRTSAIGGPSHGPGGAARWVMLIVEWRDSGAGNMSVAIQESAAGTFSGSDLRNVLVDPISTAGVEGHHVYLLDRQQMDTYWRVAFSGTNYNPATAIVLEFDAFPTDLVTDSNLTIVEI